MPGKFALAASFVVLAAAAAGARSAEETQALISLAYFGNVDDSAFPGARLAVEELNRDAGEQGRRYALRSVSATEINAIKDPAPAAILAATDAESLRLLGEFNRGVPIFNLTEGSEALRLLCFDNILHVIPSQRMRYDAVAQWQKKNPGAVVDAMAWHPGQPESGAAELSSAFHTIESRDMDDYAWAGWMAVRIVAQGVTQAGSSEPSRLLAFVRSGALFDGHKGMPLSFRRTGQLRQMLFLVQDGRVVGEAPVAGVADASNLDSLGAVECAR